MAQVLLTLEDSERRHRYLNARATLETLLSLGALPVINENDTVATAEIRYGDNDRLARPGGADGRGRLPGAAVRRRWALHGRPEQGARRRASSTEVLKITPEIEAMGGRSASEVGSGGMATKILAARIAVAAGCHMCIAAGRHRHPVRRIEEGARCTWFVPSATPVAARKQWIAGTLRPAGAVTHRSRRPASAARRQEPAAGRGRRRPWQVRAWRHGQRPGHGRCRGRARHRGLLGRRCGADHGPQVIGNREHPRLPRRATR